MTKIVKREGAEEKREDEEMNDERKGTEDETEDELELNIHIKYVTNKEKTRVLFAESGSDFVDALLTCLLLPLGTIVKFLNSIYTEKTPTIGSLNTLFDGLVNLDNIHFLNKGLLLNPKGLFSIYEWPKFESGLTESAASFAISDDLKVIGCVEGSVMSTLDSLGITLMDMDGAEIKDATFNLLEILDFLTSSLITRYPLTDFLLERYEPIGLGRVKQRNSLDQIGKKNLSINSKKMILKAMMQKSTNKLLFAQAQHDFVSFLFGLLSIPLGRVEWYLHSDTGVSAIDNLHKSIPDSLFKNSLMDLKNKNMLFKPSLSGNDNDDDNEYIPLNFDPSENQFHVRGSRTYMVSDDLTVAAWSITSCVSVINEMKVPLSDVEEVELKVGLEEGLSILRASLTSTKALSEGLRKLILKNQEKQSF